MNKKRNDGRSSHELRPLKIYYDALGYAKASVLLEMGNTKVLASINLQPSVPKFLKGQKTGWLTAEYAMLPSSTHQRCNRESKMGPSSRSIEISRLIGRCLRTMVNLKSLGERTIIVDCDVLQADGSTRIASITAASLALKLACDRWFEEGLVHQQIYHDQIAGISLGLVDGEPMVDLTYEEDSIAESDFNFIISSSGKLIEIQGTAEQTPVEWETFETLRQMAIVGIKQIFKSITATSTPSQEDSLSNASSLEIVRTKTDTRQTNEIKQEKNKFFTIGTRINR